MQIIGVQPYMAKGAWPMGVANQLWLEGGRDLAGGELVPHPLTLGARIGLPLRRYPPSWGERGCGHRGGMVREKGCGYRGMV